MRIFLLLTFLVFFCGLSSAQYISNVDFDKIKKSISDTSSSYYYPRLLERIKNLDTTFSSKEYTYLYYGTVFQPYYHPYGTSNLKKEFLDLYSANDYASAIKKGEEVLMENPVDLEVLVKMSISCLEMDIDDRKRIYAIQYFSFLEVIYKSGDGKGIESAYVVISVDHEYMISSDLGLRVIGQALIQDCDLLSFSKKGQPKRKGQKKIKQLYFNVRMPLLSLSKSFKDVELPEPDEVEDGDE